MKKVVCISAILVILALLGSCMALLHGTRQVEEAHDIKSVDWLPSSATDISFYKTWIHHEARFRIPEADFVRFVMEQGFKAEEITEEKIVRLPILDSQKLDQRNSTESVPQFTVIKQGLFFELRKPNNGGWLFAYDRTTGVGYFVWAHH